MTPEGPTAAQPGPGFGPPFAPPSGPGVAPPSARPPSGPGVAPPFAAPPVDRNRRSLWIGLAVGGVALVLCCAGGILGFGLLVVAGNDQAQKQAKQSVEAFLDAVQDRNYQKAHEQICEQVAGQVLAEDIEAEFGQPAVTGHSLGTTRVGSQTVTVEAQLHYADRGPQDYLFTLVPEKTEFKICHWR
jgi:hypothetical protein